MKLFFSIFASAVIFGAFLYPELPPSIPSHWNSGWEADAFLPKSIGFLIIPVIMLWLGLLMYNLPNVDGRIRRFSLYYELFIIMLMLFLLQLHVEVLLYAVGKGVPMHIPLSVGSGILLFTAGILLGKSRRNWFVGIRTPWSFGSERNWESTHWLASRLFMLSGIIALMGFFFPSAAVYLIAVPVVLSAIISVAYSYYEHKKEESEKIGTPYEMPLLEPEFSSGRPGGRRAARPIRGRRRGN